MNRSYRTAHSPNTKHLRYHHLWSYDFNVLLLLMMMTIMFVRFFDRRMLRLRWILAISASASVSIVVSCRWPVCWVIWNVLIARPSLLGSMYTNRFIYARTAIHTLCFSHFHVTYFSLLQYCAAFCCISCPAFSAFQLKFLISFAMPHAWLSMCIWKQRSHVCH